MELQVGKRKAFAYTAAHELDAKKPTVVFAHGAGYDHSFFALQSRYFGYHGWNVLAVDLPAHGRSAGPPLSSIAGMAHWILEVLDSLKIEKASLVGHSMGALAAVECAAERPERVERIALIGVAFPMKVSEPFLEAARRNDPAAYDMETIWGHAPQVALGANPNPGMWMYGDSLARLSRLAPGVLYNDLNACNSYAAGLSSAAKVRCPVLFVLGRRDSMTPVKSGLEYAKAFTSAKTVQVAHAGHTLMGEAPDATLDALIGFLAASRSAP
jgi:pimeloyl-ACP methyl ester carboxylesterase